jgi:cytoskeletal protein CcmA (bactofilin family)
MKTLDCVAALVWAAVVLALPPPAAAGDTMCTGTLTGTFDNVVVPVGHTCFLENARVRGNVKVLEDAQFFGVNNIISGNVEGDKASSVIVDRSTVRGNISIIEAHDVEFFSAAVLDSYLPNGNIEIKQGRRFHGDWNVLGNTLKKGNIQVEENDAIFSSWIRENTVGGNVQVVKNTGPAEKVVTDNVIHKNLQCKENEEPFVGQPNAVGGKAEEQCAGTGSGAVSARAALRKYRK